MNSYTIGINRVRIVVRCKDFPRNFDWVFDDFSHLDKNLLSGICNNEEDEWTDEDIYAAAEVILQDTLRTLNDARCGLESRRSSYNWLISDDDTHPFSFRNCCGLLEYDFEEVRERTLSIIKIVH
ncbi:hypothetical protein [Methylomonas sp. AM2-LC]|uniref:hypothetical protein n=1 Tax=Methylomonas sp. AM2-LC TaxID=3153301 RepID=UPI0032656DB1